jgi:uncharacterized protein
MPPSIETRVAQQIAEKIAAEVACRPQQVLATAALLDEGATVPFIARYRKEVTGGLDDIQLRLLDERLTYLRELEDRRSHVLASIDEQGKLSPELAAAINAAETKQRLEDLYLPYKPKRRSKAQAAREAGLAPLAEALLADPLLAPEVEAERYLNADAGFSRRQQRARRGPPDPDGTVFAEDAALLGELRSYLEAHGFVKSTLVVGKESEAAKFQDYFAYAEPLLAVPSHRALALFRGRNEGLLQLALVLDNELDDKANGPNPCESRIARRFGIVDQGRPADRWLADTVRWTWRIKALAAPRTGIDERAARARRSRGDPGLRRQPARPAARRTRRQTRDHGSRSRPAHRRQGRRRRPHRQTPRHRHDLPTRAAP